MRDRTTFNQKASIGLLLILLCISASADCTLCCVNKRGALGCDKPTCENTCSNLEGGCWFTSSGGVNTCHSCTTGEWIIDKCATYPSDACLENPCQVNSPEGCLYERGTCITAPGAESELSEFIDDVKTGVYEVVILLYCIVLYLASALAALFIILTGLKYMSSDDGAERLNSRKQLTYALIGLLVIAMACPAVNMFFSGGDIGIPDKSGNKVPCPGCPFIYTYTGGDMIVSDDDPVEKPTPEPSPTPAVSPTPSGSPTPSVSPTPGQSGTEEQCSRACIDAGYAVGKCASDCVSPGNLLSFFTCAVTGKTKCCCTPSGSGGYSSCDEACKDQLDGTRAPKYTGGSCRGECSGTGIEAYSGFDCPGEGPVCCCVKAGTIVNPGEEGSTCLHSSECNDGLYCSGGAIDIFERGKCKKKLPLFGSCDSKEEIDRNQNLICDSDTICYEGDAREGFDPKTCAPRKCNWVYTGAICCTASQECGTPREQPGLAILDCPGSCCNECTDKTP
jgi:hypothetical protein